MAIFFEIVRPPITLNYAPRLRWSSRVRRVIPLLILIQIGLAVWWFGPKIYGRGKVLYWQRAVVHFQPPGALLVREDNPHLAEALAGTDGWVLRTNTFGPSYVTRTPACCERYY